MAKLGTAAGTAGRLGGPTELVSLRARLTAEEREALEAIKGDLCQWLARPDVLSLDIGPATFLERLESGVELCKLARLIYDEWQNKRNNCQMTVPELNIPCKPMRAARGSAMFLATARNNVSLFISWCRELGVEESIIFESVGLVEHSDERRVVLCLLDVARFADKVGINPPELVAIEKEIELLEAHVRDEMEEEHKEEEEEIIADEEEEWEEIVTETEVEDKSVEDNKESPIQMVEEGELKQEEQERKEKEVEVEDSSKRSEQREAEVEEKEKEIQKGQEEEEEEEEIPLEAKEDSPPIKRIKCSSETSETELITTPTNQKIPRKRGTPQDKLRSSGKKETVDKKVMKYVRECTCEHSIEVQNCGNGKFNISNISSSNSRSSTITFYARLLSDRVMVRVGGGWETLEHFLLKHDPCRAQHINTEQNKTFRNTRKRPREQ